MQLQEGDQVKLCELTEEILYEPSPGIAPEMRPYFGGFVTVQEERDSEHFRIKEDGQSWIWHKNWVLDKENFTIPENISRML